MGKIHEVAGRRKLNIKDLTDLLGKGHDVNEKDESGMTPLHHACYKGSLMAIGILLHLKADVNAVDDREWTPLHLALKGNKNDNVGALLRHGADETMVTGKKNDKGLRESLEKIIKDDKV